MPSRRMIDPAFWQSETISTLPLKQRYLFIGLFSNADDQGRHRAHPALIRNAVFPYDDPSLDEIEQDLAALAEIGCVHIYEAEGKAVLQIVNWWKYQSPQWAYPSEIPAPEGWTDRLRYRKDGEVHHPNWDTDGGFDCANDGEPDDTPRALPKDLPKDLGKDDSKGDGQAASIRTRVKVSNSDEEESFGADAPAATAARASPDNGNPKQPTEHQLVFGLLVDLCGLDLKLLTQAERGRFNALSKRIREAEYTVADIEAGCAYWRTEDWRGKKGQYPANDKQILEALSKAKKRQQATAPGRQLKELKPCPT